MTRRRGKKSSGTGERPDARRDAVGIIGGRAREPGNASIALPSSRRHSSVPDRPERVVITLRERAATARPGRFAVGEGRGSVPRRGGTLRIGLTVPARATSDVDADEIETPSEDEVNRAVDTLMRLSAARADEEWDRAVDGLRDSPSLDVDRLHQAQQHAALRRWVLDEVELLGPGEIAEFLPQVASPDVV